MSASVEPHRVFPGGGGSGRDPQAHERILRAARDLLMEVGYARLTVGGVAARAGVGKPTIYRWWRNKGELVHEAIAVDPPAPPPDTGDLAHDLGEWIRRVVTLFSRPEVAAALPGLLADVASDRTTTERIEAVGRTGVEHLAVILDRAGVDRNRARMIADMVIGAVVSRNATTVDPPGPEGWDGFARELIELLVAAIAPSAAARRDCVRSARPST